MILCLQSRKRDASYFLGKSLSRITVYTRPLVPFGAFFHAFHRIAIWLSHSSSSHVLQQRHTRNNLGPARAGALSWSKYISGVVKSLTPRVPRKPESKREARARDEHRIFYYVRSFCSLALALVRERDQIRPGWIRFISCFRAEAVIYTSIKLKMITTD